MFRLLRETTLPGLRHLIITLGTVWPRVLRRVTFYPMRYLDEDGSALAQTSKLDPSVADRLESVLINLDAVEALEHSTESLPQACAGTHHQRRAHQQSRQSGVIRARHSASHLVRDVGVCVLVLWRRSSGRGD
jgi:hypothetical protein